MPEKTKAKSGVDRLDELLEGLFIGDNVVWYDSAGSLAWVFCLNFLQASQSQKKPIIYISFDRSPKTLLERLGALADYPKLTIMDCFTNGKGNASSVFAKFYEGGHDAKACRIVRAEEPRDMERFSETLYGIHAGLPSNVRLVFESLTGMQEVWGGEEQLTAFYSHACPRLYELETIAYWLMEKEAHSSRLAAQINQIAQVVIELAIKRGTTSLNILKAEGRETTNIQKPVTYWARDHTITFGQERRTAGGFDLGLRLKELRTKSGLSQTEVARLVGVTPSTISQVESNLIYPSMPALLKMAEVLKVELVSFFRDTDLSLRKIVFTAEDALDLNLPDLPPDILSVQSLTPVDFDGRVEPFLVEISPGKSVPRHFLAHKGDEFGYLITGQLEMKVGRQSYNLTSGHSVYLTSDAPDQWHNPGTEPARLLWLKIR